MKLVITVALGVLASFALTVFSEMIVFSYISAHTRFPELLVVALIVGALVGLVAKEKARTAAGLSLAPWALWLIFSTNGSSSPLLRWVTTVALVSLYFAFGVGVAAFVGRRMTRPVYAKS